MESSKPRRIATWSLSILLGLLFLASGAGTLTGGMDEVLNGELGVPLWALPVIGLIKIAAAIAVLVPRTRFYGATALVATMLGAVATHLVNADFLGAIAPLLLGALAGTMAWITRPAKDAAGFDGWVASWMPMSR
ncbi:MAG: DoxX family protein [Thermoplasmatota archaeon]